MKRLAGCAATALGVCLLFLLACFFVCLIAWAAVAEAEA